MVSITRVRGHVGSPSHMRNPATRPPWHLGHPGCTFSHCTKLQFRRPRDSPDHPGSPTTRCRSSSTSSSATTDASSQPPTLSPSIAHPSTAHTRRVPDGGGPSGTPATPGATPRQRRAPSPQQGRDSASARHTEGPVTSVLCSDGTAGGRRPSTTRSTQWLVQRSRPRRRRLSSRRSKGPRPRPRPTAARRTQRWFATWRTSAADSMGPPVRSHKMTNT